MKRRHVLSERGSEIMQACGSFCAICLFILGFILSGYLNNIWFCIIGISQLPISGILVPHIICKMVNSILIIKDKHITEKTTILNDFETNPIYRKDYFKALKELNEMFPGGGL